MIGVAVIELNMEMRVFMQEHANTMRATSSNRIANKLRRYTVAAKAMTTMDFLMSFLFSSMETYHI